MALRNRRPWTAEELEQLAEFWAAGLTPETIGRRLQRTPIACRRKAIRLDLRRAESYRWTDADVRYLVRNWGPQRPGRLGPKTIAKRLGRPLAACTRKMRSLRGTTGSAYAGTMTVAKLAKTSGYAPSQIRKAIARLGLKPVRRSPGGRWWALTLDEIDAIIAYLGSPDDHPGIKRCPHCKGAGIIVD